MTAKHRCPLCHHSHYPQAMHLDRAISGALVGFLLALGLFFLLGAKGCATRRPTQEHPGATAVERLHYCARVHQGAHLPQDQEGCERW